MEIYNEIRKKIYQDSMKLMQLAATLNNIPGVISCGIAMGTPENKSLFQEAGLMTEQLLEAGPNDLCIVIKAEAPEVLSVALGQISEHFSPKKKIEGFFGDEQTSPKSISTALRQLPDANLAMISVPGPYAALEAAKALNNGLHVFLFSDNVPLQDEIDLKALAEQKGLLMMGPDCGTAIISGIPLGFSNNVRRGKIGIVAASGSGMQEVCCLIHRMGEGISQAIGTGGRDLYREVGGKTFVTAMDAFVNDEETNVIILMSKHCDEKVAKVMVEKAGKSKKPIVAYFPNADSLIEDELKNIYKAADLEHIATSSVALVRGNTPPRPITKQTVSQEMLEVIASETSKFSPEQKYVRALFTGGTFADEANVILSSFFDRIYAYPSYGKALSLENPLKSMEHCIVDLGDDLFTKGKLHPMIDPMPRIQRIAKELEDRHIRVFLMDVVLGYGAHPDPGGILAKMISDAKRVFEQRGEYLSFVLSLCGTEEDPQNYNEQKMKLEKSGAVVTGSTARAALLAGLIGSKQKN